MGKGGRTSMAYGIAHSWEFWRLVAVIFSVSFLIQLLLFMSLAQFTQFSECYNLFSSGAAGYEVEGTFEPTTGYSDVVSPAPSYLGGLPQLYSDAGGNASSVAIPEAETDLLSNPLPNCTCAADEGSEALEQPIEIKALQPLTFALYPFVKFSTYRVNLNTFFVIGISSVVARTFDTPVYNCVWEQRGREIVTTSAEMIYTRWDENRMPYVPAIVNCTFPSPVGAEGNGGTLRLAVSIKPKRDSPSGTLTVHVHEEWKGEVRKFNDTLEKFEQAGAASLPYKYAFCGPPMFGRIRPDWIVSWLTYHYRLYEGMEGKVRFFFYNTGGLNDAGKKVLDPFIKAGVIEIVDIFDEWRYPAHYHNQLLFINDCLQRTRYMSQWTLFHDFDEFLYIPPPLTLSTLLEENESRPWLTFASLPASWNFCTRLPESNENIWPVEKMLWVEREPECRYQKSKTNPWICTGPLGRRKYVVNPRKVLASGVHGVTVDTECCGVDLNGTIARVHHYHGALATNNYLCGRDVNSSFPSDNTSDFGRYIYDDSVALEISKAREMLAPLLGEN